MQNIFSLEWFPAVMAGFALTAVAGATSSWLQFRNERKTAEAMLQREFQAQREMEETLARLQQALERQGEILTADGTALTQPEIEVLRKSNEELASRASALESRARSLERALEERRSAEEVLGEVRARLYGEGRRLGRDSWINLIIGMGFAFGGIWLLAYSVFFLPSSGNETLAHQIPRLSFGVFVNVIAFFFFRMYLANQNDLRHTKNELTTIELKAAALRVALVKGEGVWLQELEMLDMFSSWVKSQRRESAGSGD